MPGAEGQETVVLSRKGRQRTGEGAACLFHMCQQEASSRRWDAVSWGHMYYSAELFLKASETIHTFIHSSTSYRVLLLAKDAGGRNVMSLLSWNLHSGGESWVE